jgi:hypothetical protein
VKIVVFFSVAIGSPRMAAAERLAGGFIVLGGLTGRPDRLIKADGTIIVEEWNSAS